MKKTFILFLSLVLIAFFLPYGISEILSRTRGQAVTDPSFLECDAITSGSFDDSFKITVYNTSSNCTEEFLFEDYLVGVLGGEMPPTYHPEALKAQAVAARSFILSKVADYMQNGASDEHHGAMVCTDYKHCKAWESIEEQRKKWDPRFSDLYEEKIRQSVEQTKGEYMTYGNKVVKAYFYAISSGKTENVEEVWETSLPYLKSVNSYEDISSDGFNSETSYPKDLFVQKLKNKYSDIEIENPSTMVGKTEHTQGGSVATIEIGGKQFKGSEIRDIFQLRSANFEIITQGDKITFKVKGYGHGVGMSQNGANALANKGKDYIDILKHYYTGISISNLY